MINPELTLRSIFTKKFPAMTSTLSDLIEKLYAPEILETQVIPWGCPVPSFGDLARAQVATLGLNPSNREFVDADGTELDGDARRFHTLTSLGIAHWSDAKAQHLELIVESCRAYFSKNPYDGWFRQLDFIISGTNTSYYAPANNACHLDLIPFATTCKLTSLTYREKLALLEIAGDTLVRLLNESHIRILILNGRTVVQQFEAMIGTPMKMTIQPTWALRRGNDYSIMGHAYRAEVKSIGGSKLRQKILALGFNHNIQSSFGVTNNVRKAIQRWIAREARNACI